MDFFTSQHDSISIFQASVCDSAASILSSYSARSFNLIFIILTLAFSYCINLALSDTTTLSAGFAAISTACSPSSPAVDCFRGGRQGEIRLLKGISVLHLAALHGVDQVG
jgi:hypothetical protein